MSEDNSWKLVEKLTQSMPAKEAFTEDIRAFSKYISLCDRDYYYNETFLNEYIDEFYKFAEGVKRKKQIFEAVLQNIQKELEHINKNTEGCITLRLDGTFQYDNILNDKKKGYILSVATPMDKWMVLGKKVQIWIKLVINKEPYLLCKEYEGSGEGLIERIRKDMQEFFKGKLNDGECTRDGENSEI